MLTSGCVFHSQTRVHKINNLTEFPAHIEQYCCDYIGNRANDQSKILHSFCTMLRGKHEFSKFFEIAKIDVSTLDIWKISPDDNTMHLLQLRGGDGFVAHAVSVCNRMIF
jgi:hypothetical protein